MGNLTVNTIQNEMSNYDLLKFAERLPFVSTVTSIASLVFMATTDLPSGPCCLTYNEPVDDLTTDPISGHTFSQYVYEAPAIRLVTLLIPVIGNIVVAIYDLINAKYDDAEYMLNEIKTDYSNIYKASPRLINDLNFLFEACEVAPRILDDAITNKLCSNRERMLAFIEKHPEHTAKACVVLLRDKKYVESALEIGTDPCISNKIGYTLLDDPDIIRKAVRHAHPLIIDRIQGKLRDDLEFQRELVRINPKAYIEAQDRRSGCKMEELKDLMKTLPDAFRGREEEISSARTEALPILDDDEIVHEVFMNQEFDEEIREAVLFGYLGRHQSSAPMRIIEMAFDHSSNIERCYGYLRSHPQVINNLPLAIKAVMKNPQCFEIGYTTCHRREVQEALKEHHPRYYAENNIETRYPVESCLYGRAVSAAKVDDESMMRFKQSLMDKQLL